MKVGRGSVMEFRAIILMWVSIHHYQQIFNYDLGLKNMAEAFIGEIRMVGFNYAPRGWALCNGQTIPIQQNSALFALLGTTFGGNGQTNFALPNLQSRVPIHAGQGPGLSPYVLGQQGGFESVTLSTVQMPSHSHALNATNTNGTSFVPGGNVLAADGNTTTAIYSNAAPSNAMNPASIGATGGNQAHTNIQPYLAVYFIICLEGIFPARN
jgi:microcystin-dependent protein